MRMIVLIVSSSLFGLIVGSFLNVLIIRLPQGKSPTGRSHCPYCMRLVRWYDLVPILSFLILRGRCRFCKHALSWQYPLIELFTGIIFMLSAIAVQPLASHPALLSLTLLRNWIVSGVLIFTAMVDLKHQIIFDAPLGFAAIAVFALNLYLGNGLWLGILAGIIGISFFGLQYVFSRGQWIGGGDIVLGGFLGLALSFPNIFVALALAYLMGTAIVLPLLAVKKYQWKSRIAFGAFLSCAGIITLLWGDHLRAWYLRLVFT